MLVLRDYQQRCVDDIRKSYSQGHRKILVASPTGSGKGAVMAKMMDLSTQKGKHSIFLASKRELIYQCEASLGLLGIEPGMLMADSENAYHFSPTTVIAKDTLWARRHRSNKIDHIPASLVLIDEAHESMCMTTQKILQSYSNSLVIGFTATPCRMDGKGLGDFYDDLVIMSTYKELQELGYLCKVKLYAPFIPDLKGIKSSAGDYARKPLETCMDKQELVGNIVKDWKRLAEGRVTVCFASGVQHSIHIRNEFERAGVHAEHIDGTTEADVRDDILKRFRAGQINVLCNYGILTHGTDVPALKCAIIARPTKSFGLWRQMCGRILRPYPSHSEALLIDHAAGWERHGFPDDDVDWELTCSKRVKDYHKKNQKEKGVADPFRCPECHAVYRGPECPVCGHRAHRKPKNVAMKDGQLHEVQRHNRKHADQNAKQQYWRKCVGWAIGKKQKIGAAAHLYRSHFGTWPANTLLDVPRGSVEWNMQSLDWYHLCRESSHSTQLEECAV